MSYFFALITIYQPKRFSSFFINKSDKREPNLKKWCFFKCFILIDIILKLLMSFFAFLLVYNFTRGLILFPSAPNSIVERSHFIPNLKNHNLSKPSTNNLFIM